MINWTPFHDALRTWARLDGDVEAYWAHEQRPTVMRPLATLQILASMESQPDTVTLVDATPADSDAELRPVIGICRDISVQVRTSSRSQDPSEFALHIAERLRISLSDPEVVAQLAEDQIEIISHDRIFNVAEFSDSRMESRAVLDVTFRVLFEDAGADERAGVGFFNRLRLSTSVDRADGSSVPDALLLDDEEIGPP